MLTIFKHGNEILEAKNIIIAQKIAREMVEKLKEIGILRAMRNPGSHIDVETKKAIIADYIQGLTVSRVSKKYKISLPAIKRILSDERYQ